MTHLPDSQWLDQLRNNPAYSHINLMRELGKMQAWLSVRPHRQLTKRFIVNWLNKIDPPVEFKPLKPQAPARAGSHWSEEDIAQPPAEWRALINKLSHSKQV